MGVPHSSRARPHASSMVRTVQPGMRTTSVVDMIGAKNRFNKTLRTTQIKESRSLPRVVPSYREDAKKRIIQVASEVFKEKGYYRSTMDDIAGRLGISKGAIYQYFDSKESLLAALYSGAPANLRALFSAEASKDPITGSKEVFNKMVTRANANLFVDFLAEASRNADFQKTLRENIREFTSVLEDVLMESNGQQPGPEAAQL